MKATIIIPTFDHCELIQFPIESILRQTHQDFELFIIGDGAPEKTEYLVRKYSESDSRIKYYKHPKGPRLGEAYRHQILQQATGDFVCYLADDDLYLENHLEVISKELLNVDFTHTLPVKILPDCSTYVWQVDLSKKCYQDLLLSGTNRIPLGMGAHRMDFYQKLPFGWRTTPVGVPTDLYMWQQILSYPEVRVSSLFDITALHFASPDRRESSPKDRLQELELYFQMIQDSVSLDQLKAKINLTYQQVGYKFEIESLEREYNLEKKLQNIIAVSTKQEEHLISVISELKSHLEKQDQELEFLRNYRISNEKVLNEQEQHLKEIINQNELLKQELQLELNFINRKLSDANDIIRDLTLQNPSKAFKLAKKLKDIIKLFSNR